MNTFLLVVSFILHAIAFFVIILLYYRLEQTREIERKQANLLKDMEDVLSAYVVEMKEENELFLKKIISNSMPTRDSKGSGEKKEKAKQEQVSYATINTIESQLTEDDLSALLPKYEEVEVKLKTKSTKETEDELFQQLPLRQQAKTLHNQGMPVEEIAKKLGKGVTEIELFLKFNE